MICVPGLLLHLITEPLQFKLVMVGHLLGDEEGPRHDVKVRYLLAEMESVSYFYLFAKPAFPPSFLAFIHGKYFSLGSDGSNILKSGRFLSTDSPGQLSHKQSAGQKVSGL
ncbi:hypothetical protein ILYODFUR_006412 [Ilyodon furcidens]|uniref:Uncharacterized protein n=1 Tax=Ilyodon furcidens TaxID=33524 RepID=A0ABV0T6Y9_9TELE